MGSQWWRSKSVVENQELPEDVWVPSPSNLLLPHFFHLLLLFLLLLFVESHLSLDPLLLLLPHLVVAPRGASDPHSNHPTKPDHRLLGGDQSASQCTNSQVQGSILPWHPDENRALPLREGLAGEAGQEALPSTQQPQHLQGQGRPGDGLHPRDCDRVIGGLKRFIFQEGSSNFYTRQPYQSSSDQKII